MAGSSAYERLEEDAEQQELQPNDHVRAATATTVAPPQHQHQQQYPIAVAAAAPSGAVPTAVAMPVGGGQNQQYQQHQQHGGLAHPSSAHHQISLGGYHPGYGMPPHATGVLHLPDLPDAIQAWNRLRHIMALWMAFSIVMVVCSPVIIFIGLPLGILGIVAASLHLFESCRGRASIVGSVVTIKVLAAVIATLEFLLAGILLLVGATAAEKGAVGYLIILTLLYGSHGALSLLIFTRMQYIGRLLNPIQSGMVVL